jgi:hypothetical protein
VPLRHDANAFVLSLHAFINHETANYVNETVWMKNDAMVNYSILVSFMCSGSHLHLFARSKIHLRREIEARRGTRVSNVTEAMRSSIIKHHPKDEIIIESTSSQLAPQGN